MTRICFIFFTSAVLFVPSAALAEQSSGDLGTAGSAGEAEFGEGSSSASTKDLRAKNRLRAHFLRRETSRLLREEATTQNATHRRAVRSLVAWFYVLLKDETFSDNAQREQLLKVRTRLVRIQKSLIRKQKRADRACSNTRGRSSIAKPKSNRLARSNPLPAVAPEPQLPRPTAWTKLVEIAAGAQVGGVGWLAQIGAGGPGGLGGPFGPGGAGNGRQQADDNGDDLVDLIQTVISPETWDVNGGLGTIYYYRSLRVLVISAPG